MRLVPISHGSPLAIAVLLFASSHVCAQTDVPSVLSLNKSFHYGELGLVPSDALGQGEIFAARILTQLNPDLTFSLAATAHEALESGALTTGPVSASGVYTVTPDARVILDLDPTMPGTDVIELQAEPSANLFVSTRNAIGTPTQLGIGIAVSSGQSVATLNGNYRLVANGWDFDVGGIRTNAISGVVNFDGLGNWTLTGSEEEIDSSGTSTLSAASDSGTYAVAPDGILTLGPTLAGAVSQNGEVFYFVALDPTSSEVALFVGVKIGANQILEDLEGDWRVVGHEVALGTAPTDPNVFSESGVISINALSSTSGTAALESRVIESDPTNQVESFDSFTGSISLQPNGDATVFDPAGQPVLPLTFSANGEMFVSTELGSGYMDLVMGVRSCAQAKSFGTPTAGTGGIGPLATMSGFPVLGNPNFSLQILDGLGGAPAVLILSVGSIPGFPFLGGTIWFDPGLFIVDVPMPLGGTPGVAGDGSANLPLFVPATSTLGGQRFVIQGFVLDPGSPGGLSMTQGFDFTFCDD